MKTLPNAPEVNRQQHFARWMMVAIFAAAMAWVESAVVFYLRTMIDRIEPYQTNPFPMIGGFAAVELPRELATLIMLLTVGMLAGKTWRSRGSATQRSLSGFGIFFIMCSSKACVAGRIRCGIGTFSF